GRRSHASRGRLHVMTDASDDVPKILDLPIGLDASGMRREFDSLGDVEVPANRYWGAQTQRSLEHFNIGNDRMPKEVYHAYGYVKKAVALVNSRAGRMPEWKGQLIQRHEAQRPFCAAGRRRLHHGLGHHGRAVRRRLDEPRQELRTGSRRGEP